MEKQEKYSFTARLPIPLKDKLIASAKKNSKGVMMHEIIRILEKELNGCDYTNGDYIIGLDHSQNEYAMFVEYDKKSAYPFVCQRINDSGRPMVGFVRYSEIRMMSDSEIDKLENLKG